MSFGSRLKELRLEKRLTHIGLAKELGCSQAMISLWENDKSEPTAGAIVRVCRYFGISADELLDIGGAGKPISKIQQLYNMLDSHQRMELIGFIKGMMAGTENK